VSSTPTDGTIVLTGRTRGSFPTVNAYDSTQGAGNGLSWDGFVAKLIQLGATITASPPALLGNAPAHFAFTTSASGLGFACTVPDGTGHLLADGPRTAAACGGTSGVADYAGLADGSHTFAVATADAFGSQSGAVTKTFEVDATPPAPFEAKTPADGAFTASTQPTLTWANTTDPHGVSFNLVVDDQNVETAAPPVCTADTCTARPAVPLQSGPHTWKILASDTAAPPNAQSTAARTFVVVDPVVARFAIAPNPVLVGRLVTFDASASNDPTHTITKFEWDLDGDGTFETDNGAEPQVKKVYLAAGTLSVTLRVTDAQGQVGTSSQDLRVNSASSTAEQVGVSINKGAQYTNSPDVTLTVVAPPSTTALLVANDGGFVGSLPQPVVREVTWRLDSSGPERLPKTVYVRFLAGTFQSPNFTDDIILDERPPVVDSASVVGAAPSATAVRAAKLRKFKVKVKAHDTNSGVGGVQITTNKRKPGKLLTYKKTITVKLASRPKFIRAKDRAGNFSRWKKLR
jgi:hypothetical protein